MISFQPTEEQQMIAATVREFAQEQMRPRGHEANEARTLPGDVIRQARALGLVPANIPEQYGGFGEGHSAVTGALVAEELAHGDLSMALHILAPASVAVPLVIAGTEAQKQRWLPRFAEEGFFASAALVEPTWNFDPARPTTIAQRTESGYVLSGAKRFVIADQEADEHLLLVYARDAEAGTTQAFLVERGAAGTTWGERERGLGLQALRYHLLMLDEVEVPTASRLGGDAGVDVALLLSQARVTAVALATGLARASYEYAQDYAKQREAFGKPVAQFQAIAFMLAEMRIAVDSMRLLAWEAAWKLDQQQPDAAQAAVVARQYAAEYVLQVADRAVQILGGHGYIRDYPVERWLREARGFGTGIIA